MYQSVILLCVYPELNCMFALQSSAMNITYTFQNLGIFRCVKELIDEAYL